MKELKQKKDIEQEETKEEIKTEIESSSLTDHQANPNEDIIDINLEDPEVEKAATRIQAGFKGHQIRKELKERGSNGSVKQQEIVKEEIVDLDLEDPEVAEAATKIQSAFKGHQARKEVEEMKLKKEDNPLTPATTKEDEIIDIDLEDPEVEKAASRIQAGFKGHKARKEVQELKQTGKKLENNLDDGSVSPAEEKKIETEDKTELDDQEAAATKIQAGFKGLMTFF